MWFHEGNAREKVPQNRKPDEKAFFALKSWEFTAITVAFKPEGIRKSTKRPVGWTHGSLTESEGASWECWFRDTITKC